VGGARTQRVYRAPPLLSCGVNHSPLRRFPSAIGLSSPAVAMKTRRAQGKATEVKWPTKRAGLAQSACKVSLSVNSPQRGHSPGKLPELPFSGHMLSNPICWPSRETSCSPYALRLHCRHLGLRPTAAPFPLHRANETRRRDSIRAPRRPFRHGDVQPTRQPAPPEWNRAPLHRSRCIRATRCLAGGSAPKVLMGRSTLVSHHQPRRYEDGRSRQPALQPMEWRNTKGDCPRKWRPIATNRGRRF
jgi:hypothetical protein